MKECAHRRGPVAHSPHLESVTVLVQVSTVNTVVDECDLVWLSIKVCLSLNFEMILTLTLSGFWSFGKFSCSLMRANLNIFIDSIHPWSGGAFNIPGMEAAK